MMIFVLKLAEPKPPFISEKYFKNHNIDPRSTEYREMGNYLVASGVGQPKVQPSVNSLSCTLNMSEKYQR
jgi:hypothetical protein